MPPFCLFISGAGGTGKTFLLKAIREKIERLTETSWSGRLSRVVVAASTGIAASHIPGAGTYHLKLAVRPGKPREGFVSTARGTDLVLLKDRMRQLRAFFLDEVSMVGENSFDWLNARCCELRGNNSVAFGGLDMIFFGDLYQLPPVRDAAVFRSFIWKSDMSFYELTENVRQGKDKVYQEILNRVRVGDAQKGDVDRWRKSMPRRWGI